MASRRKSKPFRRLDTICSQLQEKKATEEDDIVGDDSQLHDSDQPTNNNATLNENGVGVVGANETSTTDEAGNSGETEKPPEGVYMIIPRSYEDDENGETKIQNRDDISGKRRSEHNNHTGKTQGLDLSVKRRKLNSHQSGLDEHESSFVNDQYGTEPMEQNNILEKYNRYKEAMKLVETQDSTSAMQKVQDFFQHQINTQLVRNSHSDEKTQGANGGSQFYDKMVTKGDENRNESGNDLPNHQEKIQALLKEANYKILEQQQMQQVANTDNDNTNLDRHAALLNMNTTAFNNMDDPEKKKDMLRMLLFNKTPISRVSPPAVNSSYETTPTKVNTITAGTVSTGIGSIKKGTLDPATFDEDVFDQYITKYTPFNRCTFPNCPHQNKDHYHCSDKDCHYQRFTNRADVIRHYNMHKKRDNSLAHGFMRFAPTEDCSSKFENCHLNGKSTHYHCLQPDCSKIYTSTSDVMTHENFHKKNHQFVCIGFKRYRATEPCGMQSCLFYDQRTTHFHCTRRGCDYTFKNKCDIDKHKSYHIRDDSYVSLGFKKFFKNDYCGRDSCAWNHNSNHFHCLQCSFSFTSTGQMVPHRKKHERNDIPKTSLSFSSYSALPSYPVNSIARPPQPNQNLPVSSHYLLQKTKAPNVTISNAPTPAVVNSHYYSNYRPLLLPSSQMASMRKPPNALCTPPAFFPPTSIISPYVAAVASRFISNQNQFRSISAQPDTPASMLDNSLLQEATRKALSSMQSPSSVSTPTSIAESPMALMLQHSTPTSGMIPRPSFPNASFPQQAALSSSPQLGSNIKNFQEENEAENQEMKEVWQNAVRGGLISPDMARNAAAAIHGLNATNNNEEKLLDLRVSPDHQKQQDKTILDKTSGSSQENPVFKYFSGAKAYECWVTDCDFMNKHHFHCMVENCAAMFATQENVLKHAKFHLTLESMGATLPITSVPNSSADAASTNDENKSNGGDEEAPPAGYIKLEKQTTAPPQVYQTPMSDPNPTNPADNELTTTPLPEVNSNALNPMQKYAAHIYAALKDLKNPESCSGAGQASPPNVSTPASSMLPYLALQNPAFSALLGKSFQPQEMLQKLIAGQSGAMPVNNFFGHQSAFNPVTKEEQDGATSNEQNDKKIEGGYVHIRAGAACLKPDCKYAMQTHWHCTMPRCRYVCKSLGKAQSHRQAHDSLEAYARSAKLSFKSYTAKKACPNPTCEFRQRGHYHCLKPGCQFATIGSSKLPWHMKKHEKIARREASGFKYYTKKEQCGRFDCKYNGLFSHYHCIRTGCRFSFQYKHQMSTHVRKHLRRMLGRTYNGNDADMQELDHANVDSGDETLPLIIDEIDEMEQRPGTIEGMDNSSPINDDDDDESSMDGGLSGAQREMLERTAKGMFLSGLPSSSDVMSANTLARDGGADNELLAKEATGLPPMSQVGTSAVASNALNLSVPTTSNTIMSNPVLANTLFSNNQIAQLALQQMKLQEALRLNAQHMDESTDVGSEDTSLNATPTTTESMFNKFRLNNDLLDGFERFESPGDCKDETCPYNGKTSHFHCTANDCTYRFTGRTHMYKHQQHHERVAALVQDDFKRYKAGTPCDVPDCGFLKNTHFHCLRCNFKCTDSARVGTHRRQHVKADNLIQSGFQQFKGQEDCHREECKYKIRGSSHFHCLKDGCTFAIVGLNGIEQHAKKHQNEDASMTMAQTQHSPVESALSLATSQGHDLQQPVSDHDNGNETGAMIPLSPSQTSSDDGSNGEPATILSKFALYPHSVANTNVSMTATVANNNNGLMAGGIGS